MDTIRQELCVPRKPGRRAKSEWEPVEHEPECLPQWRGGVPRPQRRSRPRRGDGPVSPRHYDDPGAYTPDPESGSVADSRAWTSTVASTEDRRDSVTSRLTPSSDETPRRNCASAIPYRA